MVFGTLASLISFTAPAFKENKLEFAPTENQQSIVLGNIGANQPEFVPSCVWSYSESDSTKAGYGLVCESVVKTIL